MTGRTQLSVDLIAKVGGFEAGMRRAAGAAAQATDRIKGTLGEVGPGLAAGLAAGATAAAGALAFGLKGAIDQADQLAEASERLGLTTEQFTALGFAAQFSGIESSKFEAAIRSFNSRIEKTEPLLKGLGVATRDAATGAFRPSTDIIRELGDTFARLPPGIEESQLAAELFGTRLGGQMIPLLNRGTDGIREMELRAHDLGAVLTSEAARAAGEFKDELDELKIVMNGALRDLIPQATEALRGFGDLVKDPSFLEGIGALAGALAKTAQGFGLIISESTKALGAMRQFDMDDTDAQLDRRLAALQTRISAARQASGGELPANFETTMPDVARAMKEREAIIREQRRRALASRGAFDFITPDNLGAADKPPSARGPARDPLATLRDAMEESERRTTAAAAGRDLRADFDALDDSIRRVDQASSAFQSRLTAYRDEVAGPLAQAQTEWAKREAELRDLAARGEVSTEQLTEALGFLSAARERELEAIRAQLSPADEVLASLGDELRLLQMTNQERRIENALRAAGVDALSNQGIAIADGVRAVDAARESLQFSDQLRDGFSDAFASIIDGTRSARDAFEDLGSYITSLVARRLGDNLVQSLLGGDGGPLGGGGSGVGGLLSSALGALFGGGRAAGGWVAPGKLYEVAENGPELLRIGNRQFLLPTATGGMVTPNARIGGGGGVVQNITVQGRVDNRTASQLAQESARAQARARSRLGA